MSDDSIENMSFEEAMVALEDVVSRLESGEVPLEQSIELYERGAKLKAHCDAKLAAAEEKVAQITLDETGQPKGHQPLDVS